MQIRPGSILFAAALLVAAGSLTGVGSPTEAQVDSGRGAPGEDLRFTGVYRYAESPEAGQRRVRRAVAPVLRRLNPLVRPLAESRIDETHVPSRIDLTVRPGRVAVRYVGDQGERTFRSRPGHPRVITNDAGREARMTQLFRDGQLQQVFEGENGRWYNLFRLDPAGEHLTLNVVVTADRLEAPVRVELPYVRIPSSEAERE